MDPYEWQQVRRKPAGQFNFPVRGFGPDNQFTLWVPSSTPASRLIFRSGKPVRETSESILDDPVIADLRDRTIRSFTAGDLPTVLAIDTVFLEYTAAVLGINYATPGQESLSDDDLTLIFSGDRWMHEMVSHLCGGERFLFTLNTVAPAILRREIESAAPTPLPPPITADLPAAENKPQLKRSWIQRLFGR